MTYKGIEILQVRSMGCVLPVAVAHHDYNKAECDAVCLDPTVLTNWVFTAKVTQLEPYSGSSITAAQKAIIDSRRP